MKIKNIKSIVKAWKCGIYEPEYALKLLLVELGVEENDVKEMVGDAE